MIRGALFDADGTLLDSLALWEDLGARYLARRGVSAPPSLDEILSPLTLAESSVYLCERFSLPDAPKSVERELREMLSDGYRRTVPLRPGVRGFLERLSARGVPMAVVSAGDGELLEAAFGRLDVRRYFRAVLTCDVVGAGKRVPSVYFAAAALLGAEARDVYVFEDDPNALRCAMTAGFRGVSVGEPTHGAFRLPDFRDAEAFFRLIGG